MSYEVLARKWRPRRFEELVGQGHVVRPLINALDNDRLHHAFLFTGTRGVGKTTIGRILAKSLNCEQGVSSQPCGECQSCREVDEGRFVDLIEVDAASRTKVDDTRELLNNVQYAPTRGRYKVYLIDEVHMLSGHSFNALLKTLEEPPPHVKFLLATTDPQKLPVTILSRCLQFGLKRLSLQQIADQLQKILQAENIAFDEASIMLLARAADGSMRDGLSLLDQAIAFGGGKIDELEVREMLGTIDQDTINKILIALAAGDARSLLAAVTDVAEHGGRYEAVLDSLLLDLYQISLGQVDKELVDESRSDREQILEHAQAFSPEDVQLFYQIGLHGKRDMPLAPDPRTGLEMNLLRMLAFKPVAAAPVAAGHVAQAPAAPVRKPDTAPKSNKGTTSVPTVDPEPGTTEPPPTVAVLTKIDNWLEVVEQLNLSGLLRQLADHTVVESYEEGVLTLVLDQAVAQLHSKQREAELKKALEQHYGKPVKLNLRVGKPDAETPAAQKARLNDERQQEAEAAIAEDPNVRALEEAFNARVKPGSIRSRV